LTKAINIKSLEPSHSSAHRITNHHWSR